VNVICWRTEKNTKTFAGHCEKLLNKYSNAINLYHGQTNDSKHTDDVATGSQKKGKQTGDHDKLNKAVCKSQEAKCRTDSVV
jgi:hypothetical protein